MDLDILMLLTVTTTVFAFAVTFRFYWSVRCPFVASSRHGTDVDGVNAQSVLAGTRSVLVGAVSVQAQSRWQRLVSMFRLWGLFARRVRYLADRGPSGEEGEADRHPASDLAGEAGVGEGAIPERGLDPDGNDPLEF